MTTPHDASASARELDTLREQYIAASNIPISSDINEEMRNIRIISAKSDRLITALEAELTATRAQLEAAARA